MMLAAVVLLEAPLAIAAGPLDDLEMDVIRPGQLPKGQPARIGLPRPSTTADPAGGVSGYQDAIPDSLLREGGQVGGDGAPASPGDHPEPQPEPPPP
jgi:hypothetical protein